MLKFFETFWAPKYLVDGLSKISACPDAIRTKLGARLLFVGGLFQKHWFVLPPPPRISAVVPCQSSQQNIVGTRDLHNTKDNDDDDVILRNLRELYYVKHLHSEITS